MQYLDSFYLLDQLPLVSQLKLIPWSTGLSGVTTTRRLATFSKSFYGLPIGSFPTFKGPLISLAKTPLNVWFHVSLPEVESSRTSLASRTDFEVLGLGLEGQVLGLEASSPRKLACPRLEDSTVF